MLICLYVIVLFLNFRKSLCQDDPCYTGWVYSQKSGKCYRNLGRFNNKTLADQECSSILKALTPMPLTTLTRIKKDSDMNGLLEKLVEFGNNEPLWLDLKDNKWSDGTDVDINVLKNIDPSIKQLSGCMTIKYFYQSASYTFSYKFSISRTECSEPHSYVCEHESVSCNMDIKNFDPNSMQLIPNLTTIFSWTFVDCLPGYYRKTIESKTNNTAFCTGSRDGSGNPSLYKSSWISPPVDFCDEVSCAPFRETLQNVESQITSMENKPYRFGYAFTVQCLRGYVSYFNKSDTNAFIKCQQTAMEKSKGVWVPLDNKPCVEIQCDMGSLKSMIPSNSRISSARNKVTQQQYDKTFQESLLPLYNNIITLQCNDGYFYPDRTWVKEVICGLANNSLTIGAWQGYLGTTMPLYPACESATCKYELIWITPALNIKPIFMVMDTRGNFVNQTSPDGNPYPFGTKALFLCNDGYSSALGNNSQILTCGPQGNWIPNLTPCLSIIPPIPSGPTRHYIPPPIEGSSAKQIGCVAIIIMAVFLSMIVVLDMSTVPRDIKVLRSNLRNLNAALKGNSKK